MVTFLRFSKVTCLAIVILVLGAASAMAQGGRGGGGDRGRGGPGGFGNMSEADRNAMRERYQNMSEADRNSMRERMMGGRGGPSGNTRAPQSADERWAMMARRYKEGFSEDEWKIVEPRLRPVVEKKREIDMSRYSGRFGRGPSGDTNAPETTATKLRAATSALRELLKKEDSKTADIKAKMVTIRNLRKKAEEERKKMEEDLNKKRAKLREVLSIRQEAKLFTEELLD